MHEIFSFGVFEKMVQAWSSTDRLLRIQYEVQKCYIIQQ